MSKRLVAIRNKSHENKADASSEVLVLQALQRRSLAMAQANLIEYREMELWREKLLRARLTDPPVGFCKPSWSQLIAADKQLFNELRDLTRSGVQSSSAGVRPLDTRLANAMRMHEVLCLLQPLPHPVPSASRDESTKERRHMPFQPKVNGRARLKAVGRARFKAKPQTCRSSSFSGVAVHIQRRRAILTAMDSSYHMFKPCLQ